MFKLAAILLLAGSTAAYLVDDIDEQPFFSSSQPEKCDVPPKYWCSSQSVARRCGVERQCDEWNSRFTPERQLRDGAKPVNVTIYFESLCPDCQNFFLTQVAKAAKILPANIMILDFVPFGNAKMNYNQDDDSYDFTCQHGPNECLGNVFETCATYVLKDFTKQLEYILCVENKTTSGEDIKNSVTECAKLDIPTSKYDSWLHCGQGHVGNALEGSMGTRTASLSPTHTFVPWVTFNGAGSETISYAAIDDLVKSVCSFYSGPGKCPPSSSGDALNVY